MIPAGIIDIWQQNPKEMVLNLVGLGLTEFPLELSDKMDQIYRLDISENSLKTIPPMKNLRFLICRRNIIDTLPYMPKLRYLDASHNNLTYLGDYPNLETVYLNFNTIANIGRVPSITVLFAVDNKLVCLPIMPNIDTLIVNNNPLLFSDSVYKWQIIWQLRSLLELKKLVNIIHKWQRIAYSSKNKLLHNDLMTNPHLPNKSTFFTKLWNPITQYVNHYQKIRNKYNIDTLLNENDLQSFKILFSD